MVRMVVDIDLTQLQTFDLEQELTRRGIITYKHYTNALEDLNTDELIDELEDRGEYHANDPLFTYEDADLIEELERRGKTYFNANQYTEVANDLFYIFCNMQFSQNEKTLLNKLFEPLINRRL